MPVMIVERSTSAMMLVGFLADVGLYKYLNVPFPDNFVSFCEQMEPFAFPNIFANMDTVHGGNNLISTIGKFQFWEVSTVLLDNSCFEITKELMMLAIIAVLNILVLLLKGYPKINDKFRKLRGIFMWNVFLSYFLGDFSELLLHSMVQMRENQVSSAYAHFSLALAIIIVSTYVFLACYFRYILNKRIPQGTETPKAQSAEQWDKIPENIGIIVEDFHENSKVARNFILIMLLETFLQICVVFFFQDNGLTQAILYTIIEAVYVIVGVCIRPYKSNLQLVILLMNQSSKVGMGIMAIIFGINEIFQFLTSEWVTLLGFMLTLLIIIVIAMNLAISMLIMIISLYERCKEWRSNRKKDVLKSRSKSANAVLRGNSFIVDQNSSHPEDVSLDFQNSSNLKEYKHIQNQSFQEARSQVASPSSHPSTLILAQQRADSKRVLKRAS